MLAESRLFSFINQKDGFTLHFLEGQKLIHDHVLIHPIHQLSFSFYRDLILTSQLLLAFLKPDEHFGLYIDSDEPYLRYKIEMNENGLMRSLFLPENPNFQSVDELNSLTGKCRLYKMMANAKEPYVSVLNFEKIGLNDITNLILKNSYQLSSHILLSPVSDQALMISKLPQQNVDKQTTEQSLEPLQYWDKIKSQFESLFSKHSCNEEDIIKEIESFGLQYLASKEVKFKCGCSKERMVRGLWTLCQSSGIDQVFMPDEQSIETKCDYCQTTYQIARSDIVE